MLTTSNKIDDLVEILVIILVFQDRVGGRTYGRQLKAAKGTDTWDLGGQWIGRWEDYFVEE